jgi:lauroyl/myristoyl acyltransferase
MHAVIPRRKEVGVRGYLVYISYRLLAMLIGRLPPRAAYWLAVRVSRLLYLCSSSLRRTVHSNMRHVLGPEASEAQVEATTRLAFVNIAKGHYDLFRVARLSTKEIKDLAHVNGMENLLQTLAGGRGAIVISAHFGNVDLVVQVPLAYGIKINGAVQHIQPERLFRYLLKLRQSHGLRLIPTDEPLIALFRALKRGEILALPCDRDVSDNGRIVEFFGTRTRLPDGPIRVALRTGTPVIPAFARRLPNDAFEINIEPPLDLEPTGDLEADVDAGMKLVVATMERYISKNPEQWLVAAPIWPLD